MPEHYLLDIERAGLAYEEHGELEGVMPELDILYATRIQAERFPDPTEYERVKHAYVIAPKHFRDARPNCKLMHPLPRVNEIATAMDETPFAYYFQQAANGIPVRQALLSLVLGAAR
jgi:aspartate carbamoyltransferase catalytic subunit